MSLFLIVLLYCRATYSTLLKGEVKTGVQNVGSLSSVSMGFGSFSVVVPSVGVSSVSSVVVSSVVVSSVEVSSVEVSSVVVSFVEVSSVEVSSVEVSSVEISSGRGLGLRSSSITPGGTLLSALLSSSLCLCSFSRFRVPRSSALAVAAAIIKAMAVAANFIIFC